MIPLRFQLNRYIPAEPVLDQVAVAQFPRSVCRLGPLPIKLGVDLLLASLEQSTGVM
jgi:hypothetical protein